jgi:hypothetical protein
MKHITLSLIILTVWTSAVQAACYADYKAKRDDPLRLHYGVAAIDGDCTVDAAKAALTARLTADDWQLLNVLGVFDDTGLEDRKESAGDFFLRY